MDLNQSLHCAIIKGDVSEVQTLVERGASVNTTSYPDNWSPLHYAALLNRPDVMQLLIKGNADVNVVDKNDETALHVAFFHDNIPAAELLIQHGSSLQSQNIEGRRPFEVAVIGRPQNHRKRVNFECIDSLDDIFRTLTSPVTDWRPFATTGDHMHRISVNSEDMSLFEVAVDSRPHNHRKKVYLEDWRPFSAHFDHRRYFHRHGVTSEFADSLHDDSGISTLTSSINEHRNTPSLKDTLSSMTSDDKKMEDLQDIKESIAGKKPKMDDLINNRIGRKLLVADDLQIGMEIAFGRMKFADGSYIYKHHGIVIKISETCNRFEIVELRATESAFNTCLAVLCRNSRPSVQRKTLKFHDNLYYYDYKKNSFSRKLVKKRAKKMVLIFDKSGVEYNLTKFNCEHFACYCATGLACSGQTENENLEATESLNKTLGTYIDIQIEKYSNNTQKHSLGGKVLETMKPKERSCVVM